MTNIQDVWVIYVGILKAVFAVSMVLFGVSVRAYEGLARASHASGGHLHQPSRFASRQSHADDREQLTSALATAPVEFTPQVVKCGNGILFFGQGHL